MFSRPKSVLRASVLVLLTLALLTLALSNAGVAQTQLVLYDNFKSRNLDPSKWIGWQFFDSDIREAGRQLFGEEENRRLRLSYTAYSATSDDFGGSGGGFCPSLPVSSAHTGTTVSLAVNRAAAPGCAG